MITGITKAQQIAHTLDIDTEDEKTIFTFQPMSGVQMLELGNLQGADGSLSGGKVLQYLKTTLVSVTQGKIVLEGAEKDSFIETLRMDALSELIDKANAVNSLTENDRKN